MIDEVGLVSIDRLGTFKKYTGDERKALSLHKHTLQLGSSVMSFIALFELAFRNLTDTLLVEAYGCDEWLVCPDCIQKIGLKDRERGTIEQAKIHAKKAQYSKLTNREKEQRDYIAYPNGVPANTSHDKKSKARINTFTVSHGQVVAQTTIYFWKRLYSKDYEYLWSKGIRKAFPNKKIKRNEVTKHLERVYVARNRVAHHEPLYLDRLKDVMEALDFLRNNLGCKSENDASAFKKMSEFQGLRLKMDCVAFENAWQDLCE